MCPSLQHHYLLLFAKQNDLLYSHFRGKTVHTSAVLPSRCVADLPADYLPVHSLFMARGLLWTWQHLCALICALPREDCSSPWTFYSVSYNIVPLFSNFYTVFFGLLTFLTYTLCYGRSVACRLSHHILSILVKFSTLRLLLCAVHAAKYLR